MKKILIINISTKAQRYPIQHYLNSQSSKNIMSTLMSRILFLDDPGKKPAPVGSKTGLFMYNTVKNI